MRNSVLLSMVVLAMAGSIAIPNPVLAKTETDDIPENIEVVGENLEIDGIEKLDDDTCVVETDSTGDDIYCEELEWREFDTVEYDLDELLMGYLYHEAGIFCEFESDRAYNGVAAKNNLNSVEQYIYDLFKAQTQKIARGQESNPTLKADISGLKLVYNGNLEEYFDVRKVLMAVKYDCPYDYYWAGLSWRPRTFYNRTTKVFTGVEVEVLVNNDFKVSTGNWIDTNKAAATQGVIANAQAIVNSCAGLNDRDKLKYYADILCVWVDYNEEAIDRNYPYGNPWQLIWALDGNPGTKVVCEGYAKAFQLLCDMSSFQSALTRSILVAGDFKAPGGYGAHMWNIVRMEDSRNYLVDVTYMDSEGDWLFMTPLYAGTSYKYQVKAKDGTLWEYSYSDDVLKMYKPSELTLSDSNYSQRKNGLCIDDYGNYYLFIDNVFQSGYTDMYNDARLGWTKVVNGVADFNYNDMYFSPTIGWWKIKNGTLDTSYTDLYYSPTYGWWKVRNGIVDVTYTDLYCSPTMGWWKIVNGSIDFGYNDLYYSPTYGWWKIAGGSIDAGYTDFYCSPTIGWWKIYGGALDAVYTDLYCSPTIGWWKVKGGALDLSFKDLYYSPTYGWWKIVNGALDTEFTDLYFSPTYGWWKVYGGALDINYTDLYCSPTMGWWKVYGGAIDLYFDDLYNSPTIGWWKVKNGTIDFGFTGEFNSPTWGGPYNIVNGQLR